MSQRDRRRRVERALELHRNILNKLAWRRTAKPEQRGTTRARAVPGRHEQRGVPRRGRPPAIPARPIRPVPRRSGPRRRVEAVHLRGTRQGRPAARARVLTACRVVLRSDRVLEGRGGRTLAVHALDRRALHAHRPHRRRASRSVHGHESCGAPAGRQSQRRRDVAARVDRLQPRPGRHAPRGRSAANHGHRRRSSRTIRAARSVSPRATSTPHSWPLSSIDQNPDRYFEHLRIDPPSPDRHRRRARVRARRQIGGRAECPIQHAALA